MPIINVNSSALIQPALDEAATLVGGADGIPVVALDDGHRYTANVTVPKGVILRGGSEIGTEFVGTIVLRGFMTDLRMAGMVHAISEPWPAAVSMRRVIVAHMNTDDEPALRVSQQMDGGGAARFYGCTFTSNGPRAVVIEGKPEGATSGMVEIIFDEGCKAEAYATSGIGAAVDFQSGGTILALLKDMQLLSKHANAPWLRASGQNVKVYGGGVLSNANPCPKIEQYGLGSIDLWCLAGVTAADTFGNVVFKGTC